MEKIRKIICLIASVLMIFAMSTCVFAQGEEDGYEGASGDEYGVMALSVPGIDIVGTGTTEITTPGSQGSGAAGTGSTTGSYTDTQAGGASVYPAGQTTVYQQYTPGSAVDTGDKDIEMLLPYFVCFMMAVAAFFVYNKIKLDNMRIASSRVYEQELEEFRRACTTD